MKKIILSLFVVGLLALVLTLFITQLRKNPAVVASLKYSTSALKEPQEAKSKTITSRKTETFAQRPTEIFFKEFSLPQDLKAELSEAERNGNVSNEWGEGKISEEELQKKGLTAAQLLESMLDNKIKNIIAGYSMPDKTFTENLNNCLPDKAIDDKQTRILNSESLSAMGFSALMKHKYTRAEEAFTALIRNYADTLAAPIAHLELARLMSGKGRFREAQQLIDKAISFYGSDKEYLTIAQALKEEIQINE